MPFLGNPDVVGSPCRGLRLARLSSCPNCVCESTFSHHIPLPCERGTFSSPTGLYCPFLPSLTQPPSTSDIMVHATGLRNRCSMLTECSGALATSSTSCPWLPFTSRGSYRWYKAYGVKEENTGQFLAASMSDSVHTVAAAAGRRGTARRGQRPWGSLPPLRRHRTTRRLGLHGFHFISFEE